MYVRDMSVFTFWLAHCRLHERVVVSFFIYTALLSLVLHVSVPLQLIAILLPAALFGLAAVETSRGNATTNMVRSWLVPAVVLGGYWQMSWFARLPSRTWQDRGLQLDRVLLNQWSLRWLLEDRWMLVPRLLELSYLLLYAIPVACLLAVYWQGAWVQVDRFLLTFALGTLTAYALLPLIAVQSPRLAFPGEDLPNVHSVWRSINLWILDHLDISTSVFPSGHVAVAFSSALGLKSAMPAQLTLFRVFLVLAASVFVATIYGRYHYAADGVASILICLVTWRVSEAYERRA